MESFDAIFDTLNVNSDDPRFYKRAYAYTAKRLKEHYSKEGDNYKRVIDEEYGDLSRRLNKSRFQESCSVRNVLKARRLATLLINDDGELNLKLLPQVIAHLKAHLFDLGPNRQFDGPRNQHMLQALTKLNAEKNLQRQLRLVSKPYSHKIADQIIRDTLQLPNHHPVNDAHARRAVLSAWLCYLRQNVGSCFATAPAIIVQREQPELFLKDINEMLGTGRLKRTFGGVEYSVPLSSSWGAGDLRKMIAVDQADPEALEDLAFSPGILNGLEACGIIDPNKTLKEKIDENKKIILETLKRLETRRATYFLISAEILLREILMHYHQVTDKDLQDFENRPRGMLHTSLLMSHPTVSSGMGGKGEACAAFLAHFDICKNAFKSLTENALLKMWEFTLASFAETKPSFTRWNMYASLGFNTDEEGGIGACLYEEIKRKLDQSNAKVQDIQTEYEQVYASLKFMEGRMRNVSSEKDAQWLRIEYEGKRSEFRTLEEIRDREHFKSKRFANLLNDILVTYDELFPRYFQEVYDADMHEVASGPYDDSPAGFRLLYKHGRANTSQWTLIYTPQEFIESLASFFVATETEIVNDPHFKGMQQEISDLVTRIVSHVKTDQFLITSFYRMAKAHQAPLIKDPLEHLEKIDKKPWAYTSGGTMNNLISCYFRLDGKPTEQGRWVENPMELLVFIIDTLRQIPAAQIDTYLTSAAHSLLMHSPTHAFTCRPSFPFLKEALTHESYSYTWARDTLVQPAEKFIEYAFLDPEMMAAVVARLKGFVPVDFRHRFETVFSRWSGKKNPRELCTALVDAMDRDRGLQINGQNVLDQDVIDSALFEWLPLFSPKEIKNRAEKLFAALPGLNASQLKLLDEALNVVSRRFGDSPYVFADQLQNICKALLALVLEATTISTDYPLLLAKEASRLGYAMPGPILFGDTNWVKDLFAFMVNPGSGKLDLWRIDYTGREGAPMSAWSHWLDGSNRDLTWAIYTKPSEYKG